MRPAEIENFISKQRISLDHEAKLEQRYKALESYFPVVPRSINERFVETPFYDFVNENLQSHDWRKLKIQLLKRFGDLIENIETYFDKDSDTTILTVIFHNYWEKFKCISDPEFMNILYFFNYFVTMERNSHIHIEPKYSEDSTSYVYGVCKGIVYHLTKKRNLESVLKNGLRCKGKMEDSGDYRTFPQRIYCLAIDPKNTNVRERLEKFAEETFDPDEDYVALKINLNGLNINFYRDLAMREYSNCYFTYNNIPASRIEKYFAV